MLAGTNPAIVLSSNLITSEVFAGSKVDFVVPWRLVVAILAGRLRMTWVPSHQAGRLAPAEALRYEYGPP